MMCCFLDSSLQFLVQMMVTQINVTQEEADALTASWRGTGLYFMREGEEEERELEQLMRIHFR